MKRCYWLHYGKSRIQQLIVNLILNSNTKSALTATLSPAPQLNSTSGSVAPTLFMPRQSTLQI